MMGPWIGRTFLQGLLAILPLALTLAILIWLLGILEGSIGWIIQAALPEGWYVRGMGITLGLVLVFGAGLLVNLLLFRNLLRVAESQLERIPMIKTVYAAMRDLFAYFTKTRKDEMNQVVVMSIGGAKMMGVVTRESFLDLPPNVADPGQVAVYFPMSYQIGGYTLMVPRDRLQPLDMRFEDAMKFILTGGVTAEPSEAPTAALGHNDRRPPLED
jgi:uncharacterized membrane protein